MGLGKKVCNSNTITVDEIEIKRAEILRKYSLTVDLKKNKRCIRTINDLFYSRYQKKFR